jgi:hypothetical protein
MGSLIGMMVFSRVKRVSVGTDRGSGVAIVTGAGGSD